MGCVVSDGRNVRRLDPALPAFQKAHVTIVVFTIVPNILIIIKENLILYLHVFPTESSQYRSDYEYSREAGGWLKFHRVPATFTDAFLRCNAEGSNVASPLTVDLQQAMMKFAKNHTDSCGIFTGVHAAFSRGDFATVEGVPLYKLPVTWAPDEPDNYKNNEDCTIMLQNGTLADVRCNDTYPYICYKKKTDNPVLTSCGTVDREYVLDARTGSCYKFHTTGRTWRRAYMTCMAEGGHLAIINGDTEMQVIKDVFAKHPSEKIAADLKDVASIGFCSWREHGNWYTVHGLQEDPAQEVVSTAEVQNWMKTIELCLSEICTISTEGKLNSDQKLRIHNLCR
ncbi:unnamed protein product [Chilo suppressalis]|uniref:C-type lectin domain-containing protein n=1 Tax=Chilo suppressalis TaxID=168631 RepID=A0ABN8AR48_CHISP|nr:unnamed protein product [Chilo suppressalis]